MFLLFSTTSKAKYKCKIVNTVQLKGTLTVFFKGELFLHFCLHMRLAGVLFNSRR